MEEVLDLTLYEYKLMLEGRNAVDKENAELQFYVLKRAIGECISGKHKPLFKGKDAKPMSKEQHEEKFKELLEKFNKKRGENNGIN